MKDVPLFNALVNHRNLFRSSFHTPGHKSKYGVFPKELWELDYTELPDTDSLFEAEGAILKAEQEAANLFGVERTVFSAGGCTLCIQAMIRLCAPMGGKIICGRVIHRSAINTMALLGIEPIWVYPKPNAGEWLAGRIQVSDIKKELELNPDARAVYITSPDYFGVISDIKAISQECKKYNIPLIVDNAHGAHLGYVKSSLDPIKLGASMAACSAHKTLPVLTGGAWLNIKDERYVKGAKSAMALFGSTSPSYPIIASLDLCRSWLEQNGRNEFIKLQNRVGSIKAKANKKGIKTPLGVCDPIRISLNTVSIGLTGLEAAEYMRKLGVEPEYADGGYVVLIATPMNTEQDFLKLEECIENIPIKKCFTYKKEEFKQPKRAVSTREAVLTMSEAVVLDKCLGRIAAEAVCPCPPGVPIVMPGEIINKNSVNCLEEYGVFSMNVLK